MINTLPLSFPPFDLLKSVSNLLALYGGFSLAGEHRNQNVENVRSELQVQLHQAKTFHNPIDAGLIP
ncbi:hypothetical protein FRC02_006120 [Tulasnella sp. 418]|nr:hypothetical protein FRC02_006120 [Tulasnella sp. 418]